MTTKIVLSFACMVSSYYSVAIFYWYLVEYHSVPPAIVEIEHVVKNRVYIITKMLFLSCIKLLSGCYFFIGIWASLLSNSGCNSCH